MKGASNTFGLSLVLLASGWQGGQLTPIDLIVEERFHRAAPGGMPGGRELLAGEEGDGWFLLVWVMGDKVG